MQRKVQAILAAVMLLSLNGCSGDSPAGIYPVRGRVLFNGKPPANALVTFHPSGDAGPQALRPVGKVDEQGNFTLTSIKQGDGAPAGEYQVTVIWYLARRTRPGSDDTVTANYLPAKYANAGTSHLTATVTPGSNDLKPFDLK
jgi:hypothetical protein